MTRGGRRRSPGCSERGSMTVAVLAVIGVLAVLTVGGLTLGSVVSATHRARAAADLAALAAATAWSRGDPAPTACATAADLADRNGAILRSCVPAHDGSVEVRAACGLPLPVAGHREAVARARAGPVTDP